MPDISNVLGINSMDDAAEPDLRTGCAVRPASVQGALEAASGPGTGLAEEEGNVARGVRKDEFD